MFTMSTSGDTAPGSGESDTAEVDIRILGDAALSTSADVVHDTDFIYMIQTSVF